MAEENKFLRENESKKYRRSLTFLMLAAVRRNDPTCQVRIQYSIENGYYCELIKDGKRKKPTLKFLEELTDEMKKLVSQDLAIQKVHPFTEDAIRVYENQNMPDKAAILQFCRRDHYASFMLDGFMDYFYGGMLDGTGQLKGFRLEPYQHGFMLLFPKKNKVKADVFHGNDKLFAAFEESAKWGETIGVRTAGDLNQAIAKGYVPQMILVQEALQEAKIATIASRIVKDKDIKMVLIAGPSSSGKTTFSKRLSVQLAAHGKMPHPISMDDFYVNRDETPLDANGEMDFEAIEALDIPLFNQTMNDLLAGEEADMPTFNFKTGLREYRGNKMQLKEDDILVIEGIHGLNERLTSKIPKNAKYKVYISALTQLSIDYHNNMSTADGRLMRRMVRDARTRNTTAAETLERWPSVRRGEEENIFPFQEEADVIFNSSCIYETSVLKTYVEPLLFQINKGDRHYEVANRLLRLLDNFLPIPAEQIALNSIIREFIGGGVFNI